MTHDRAHYDSNGNWVVPAYPPQARVLADFTGACSHEPTHRDVARDLQLERAQLINLLCEARAMLAYLYGGIVSDPNALPHMREEALKAKAFLDRGLFGDKA